MKPHHARLDPVDHYFCTARVRHTQPLCCCLAQLTTHAGDQPARFLESRQPQECAVRCREKGRRIMKPWLWGKTIHTRRHHTCAHIQ